MPKHVQLPDGTVGEFPDNMSDAQIESVLQKQFPAPKQEQPSATYRAVSSFGQAIGAPQNASDFVNGPAYALSHPIDSGKLLLDSASQAQNDLIDKAYQYQHSPGIGNKVKGLAYGIYSALPVVGPTLARAGEQFGTGDIAGGVGTTAGVALPAVMAKAGPAVMDRVQLPSQAQQFLQNRAADLYQSALKPSTSARAPLPEDLVQTGLKNQIPISEAGKEKLAGLVEDVNNRIAQSVDKRPISAQGVVDSAAPIRQRYATQMTPAEDLNIIDTKNNEFLNRFPSGTVPADELQAMKTGTYKVLGKKYGQIGSTEVEAQKGLALGAKEQLNQAFPDLAALNAEDSAYLKLGPALDKAVARAGNRNFLSLPTGIIAGAVKGITGSGGLGVVAGVTKALLDDPAFSSRLANVLYRNGNGRVSLPEAMRMVSRYRIALATGAASNNAPPADRTNGDQP